MEICCCSFPNTTGQGTVHQSFTGFTHYSRNPKPSVSTNQMAEMTLAVT